MDDMRQRKNVGFTLIEMLAVIAIIGLLSAFIIGVAVRAGEGRKKARVDAEKHKLIAAIEAYHSKYGFYPYDNGNLDPRYAKVYDPDRNYAATNQLFYELTGPSYDDNLKRYVCFDGSYVSTNEFAIAFNREGVANSIEPKPFLAPPPKSADYKSNFVANAPNVNFLMVPVDLSGETRNPWRYDATSTNRHNTDSFDLWAVFSVGNKIVTNGNW
jgi:prepilin-type N-terminal cleavage/methylation domain-containing protein